MIIEYNLSGSMTISDIVEGYRVKRIFFGYTKREAIKAFKQYVESLNISCNK